jgi:hypothetical protein
MTKAILIDVNNRTVTEVTVTKDENGSQLMSIYEHVKCEMVEVVNIGENDIYVDEEGLLNLLPSTNFFMWKGYPQPLAGNGLIMGYDDNTGDSVDVTLTVEEVNSKVRFMTHQEVAMGSFLNKW